MTSEIFFSWALVPLRIILGLFFLAYSYPKIMNMERLSTLLLRYGVPFTKLSAVVIVVLEFFGGFALVVGFSTKIIAFLLMVEMLISAFFKYRKKKTARAFVYDLIIAALLLILVVSGAGFFSIDHTFGWLIG